MARCEASAPIWGSPQEQNSLGRAGSGADRFWAAHFERIARSFAGPLPRYGNFTLGPGWDEESAANLVSVTVTRVLGNGLLLPALVLVDRACLGAKDGPLRPPRARMELESELDALYIAYGGWEYCEPLIAQSIAFHCDRLRSRARFLSAPRRRAGYVRAATCYAPRYATVSSPRPIFIQGPRDDASAIMRRLEERVGPDGFDMFNAVVTDRWLAEFDGEEPLDADVVDQLSRTVESFVEPRAVRTERATTAGERPPARLGSAYLDAHASEVTLARSSNGSVHRQHNVDGRASMDAVRTGGTSVARLRDELEKRERILEIAFELPTLAAG